MTQLSYRNAISIFEIIYYSPALPIAIILCIKHGFKRSSGWRFMIIFTLARLLGAAMELATISSPTNISLYTGAAVLQNIGISPLLLVSYGLLSRVISNINTTRMTLITPNHLRLAQIIITVGLILGIVGGVNSGSDFASTGHYVPQTTSKASIILFFVAWVFLTIATISTFTSISAAIAGERRLLIVIAFSLPFLLVRVIYSTISAFSNSNSRFNSLTGSPTLLLILALVMEAIIVFLYEAVGLTLEKSEVVAPRMGQLENEGRGTSPRKHEVTSEPRYESRSTRQESTLLRIAKKTIIGRIVMAASGNR